MTQTELFTAFELLEARGFEKITSRYKPLTLLWAIGQLVTDQPRLTEWPHFHDKVTPILHRYGRPMDGLNARYPWQDLRTSGLWEVVGSSAGLTLAAATLLQKPTTRSRVVRTLLERFFFDVDRKALLADLGLPSDASDAGPLGDVPDESEPEIAPGTAASPPGHYRELPHLISPEEEDDRVWWEPDDDGDAPARTTLVWHAALRRMHIDGGWCPIPRGPMRQGRDGQQLRLQIEHRDHLHTAPGPEHDVTLRHRGGEWELHGVQWPQGLLPGVVVTVRWPHDTSLVTARTSLLDIPERVDGVEFLHRYDRQLVTREAAPGSDQDRAVPDLSDTSWVLRTLRMLGYLSADGTATLAEAALARNCERLGIATSRLSRLPAAVEQLVRSGRVRRVRGSLDKDDRPHHPARAGDTPAELLQYAPDVETLDPAVRQTVQDRWSGRRDAHWVTGFIRRISPGSRASDEQVELHREAVHAAEVVDQPLPEGHTFVRHHRRGHSA